MDRLDGLNWLQQQAAVRWLPVSRATRDEIAARYWFARRTGNSHRQAKTYALSALPWYVVIALQIVLPILWAKLREWWDQRNAI